MISKINEFCTKEKAEWICDFVSNFRILIKDWKNKKVIPANIKFKDTYGIYKANYQEKLSLIIFDNSS